MSSAGQIRFSKPFHLRPGTPQTMKKLIVNADDLGADEGRNAAFSKAIEAGQ